MRITIFGAAGNIGKVAVAEALKRGHKVTAVTRDAKKAADFPADVETAIGDVNNVQDVVRLSQGQDLVISATRPPAGEEQQLVTIAKSLLSGLAETKTRLLLVGGAACLTVPNSNGKLVMDDENFVPKAWRSIAQACYDQYQLCLQQPYNNWSYASPSALIGPGERTGQFRISNSDILIDESGKSHISWQDFAIALLDEAEQENFIGGKFTAGY